MTSHPNQKATVMPTYTQSHVEQLAGEALAARGESAIAADTISDAVDVFLGQFERTAQQAIDRVAITHEAATQVIDTVVSCLVGDQ